MVAHPHQHTLDRHDPREFEACTRKPLGEV
jgi:hypothetical protein